MNFQLENEIYQHEMKKETRFSSQTAQKIMVHQLDMKTHFSFLQLIWLLHPGKYQNYPLMKISDSYDFSVLLTNL